MAMLDNFKNFIRQGRQAGQKNQSKAQRNSTESTRNTNKSQNTFASKSATSSRQEGSFESIHASTPETSVTTSVSGGSATTGTSAADSGTHAVNATVGASKGGSGEASKSGSHNTKERKKHTYDAASKQIIAEEVQSRNQMPSYPGLEQYRLIEKMGDGAFSIVYKAVEIETGNERAIKVVSKNQISSGQRASVLKEAAIMRQLEHPNIVHMFAFLETLDHYFIVLELVSGGELFHQIVQLTYFSEDLSRHVIIQVAHAIRYLHEVAGVVHRDIKPENLLFTRVPFIPSKQRILRPGDDETKEDEGVFTPGVGGGGVGTIKLADFGLSKVIWDSNTRTPCGTVGYTAPEIVKDERYSKSVDMWALGCVLYTILCGFPPFYDENIKCLTEKVARGEFSFLSPWWDGISDSAKDLVCQLLTVDPEKRYNIDEFLNHPWITQKEQVPLTRKYEVDKHTNASMPSTPMYEQGGRDGAARSSALRAIDVSNAVYRLEEEALRHNHLPALHPAIMEDEEDSEFNDTEYAHIEDAFEKMHILDDRKASDPAAGSASATRAGSAPPRSSNTAASTSGVRVGSQRAAARRAAAASVANSGPTAASGSSPSFFDLHLEGATLLERRKARQTPVAN